LKKGNTNPSLGPISTFEILRRAMEAYQSGDRQNLQPVLDALDASIADRGLRLSGDEMELVAGLSLALDNQIDMSRPDQVASSSARLHALLARPELPDEVRASAASNLSINLCALNRLEEALAAAVEATEIYRRLAAVQPDAFDAVLARSLSNLGTSYSELNRREEALAAAVEATELFGRLAAVHPDAFDGDLAASLSNLGNRFSESNRREEALTTSVEATEIYRRLAAVQPDEFDGVLAASLSNLGTSYSELNRREEALRASVEATEMFGRLAAVQPDAFDGDLAASLLGLSAFYSELNRREEGLAAAVEATEIYRRLAAVQPEAFKRELARSLSNLGASYGELNRREEGLVAAVEATEIYRRLAAVQPDAFNGGLAASLSNLGNRCSELNRREEALAAAVEATEIRRRLAAVQPDAFDAVLARSLSNLGNRCSELNRREEALAAAVEATEIYRRLAAVQPDAFNGELAASLSNLGNRCSELNRREEALAAAVEATEIYRRLAAVQPDAFNGGLARSLSNLGASYSELSRRKEASSAWRESLGIPSIPLQVRASGLSGLLQGGVESGDAEMAGWLASFSDDATIEVQSLSGEGDRRGVLSALNGVGSLGLVNLALRAPRLGSALEWADATVAVEARLTGSLRDVEMERFADAHPELSGRLRDALRPVKTGATDANRPREVPSAVLDQIRQMAGWSHLLTNRSAPEIIASLCGTPVAIVAAGASGGVALTIDRFGELRATTIALPQARLVERLNRANLAGEDSSVACRLALRALVKDVVAEPIVALARENPGIVVVPVGLVAWLPIQSTLYLSCGVSVSIRPTIAPAPAVTANGEPLVVHSDGTDAVANLPEARLEAQHIAGLVGTDAVTDSPTSATTVMDRLPASRFVHFSCHGDADVADPQNSGLLIGSTMLTVAALNEEMARRAAPRFVGLSACQSARTEAASAEQAGSLANVFLAHGTRAVLATHWNVADGLSREIATGFCDRWSSGLTAGEAFDLTLRAVYRVAWRTRAIDTAFAFCLMGDRDLPWPGTVNADGDRREVSAGGVHAYRDEHTVMSVDWEPMTDDEFGEYLFQVTQAAPPAGRDLLGPLIARWLDAPDETRDPHRHTLAASIGLDEIEVRELKATNHNAPQHRTEGPRAELRAKLEALAKRK
jgi:predicted regulator of Ras-like GTPase activity (Roadblock/LC7/MglB family)